MRILLSLLVLLAILAILLLVPRESESKRRRYSRYYEIEAQKATQAIKDEEFHKSQAAKDYLTLADETRAFSPSLSLIAYMNSLFFLEELHSEFYSKKATSSDVPDGCGRYLDDLLHIRNDIIPDVRLEGLLKARHNLTELILYQYSVPRSFRFSKSFPFSSFLSDIYRRSQCKTVDKRFFNDLITADEEYGNANAENYIRRFMKRWEELDQKYPPEDQDYSYKEPEPDPLAISTLAEYSKIAGKRNTDDIIRGILIEQLESEYAYCFGGRIDHELAQNIVQDIYAFSIFLFDSTRFMHDHEDISDDSLITLFEQLCSAGMYETADTYAGRLSRVSDPSGEKPGIIRFLKSIAVADKYSADGNFVEANRILDDYINTKDISILASLPPDYILKIPESYKKANNLSRSNEIFAEISESDLLYYSGMYYLRLACSKWLYNKGEYIKALDILERNSFRIEDTGNYLVFDIITKALQQTSPEIIVRHIEMANYIDQRLYHLSYLSREMNRQGIDFDAKSVFGNTLKDILKKDDKYEKVPHLLTVANAYIEDDNSRDARALLGRCKKTTGGWFGIYRIDDVYNLINITRLYYRNNDKRNCGKTLELAWKVSLWSTSYARPSYQRMVINLAREMGFDKKADKFTEKIKQPEKIHYGYYKAIESYWGYIGYPGQALANVLNWDLNVRYSDIHTQRYLVLHDLARILMAYGLYDEAYTAIYEQSVSDPLMQGDRAYWPDNDFRKEFVMRFAEVGRFDLAFKAMAMMKCDIAMQKAVSKIAKCMREQEYELTESDKQCLRAIVYQDPFFIKYPCSEMVNRISN